MAILPSINHGGLTLVLTPVVLAGWSNLYLKRHTQEPAVAGGGLGSMIFLVPSSH